MEILTPWLTPALVVALFTWLKRDLREQRDDHRDHRPHLASVSTR